MLAVEQPAGSLTRRCPREEAVARLQEMQRLRAQGLSIPEIKALLETKGFHPEEFYGVSLLFFIK